MKTLSFVLGLVLLAAFAISWNQWIASAQAGEKHPVEFGATDHSNSQPTVKQGQQTFRFDTFEDEAWWGDTLHLHQAIEGDKFGGVGPGISPATALSLGLKVDLDALPDSLVQQLKMGKVNLNDPAVTLALLKLNAVVGVTGHSNPDGQPQISRDSVCAVSLHSGRRARSRNRSPPRYVGQPRFECRRDYRCRSQPPTHR
jgi:hypothetical protein